jgi:hypothetical protein
MNEIKFTNKIRQALNEGARLHGERGARVAERLRAARERALERRRIAREPSLAWAGSAAPVADDVAGGFGDTRGFSLRMLLATALLLAGLFGIYRGQQDQQAAEVEELDAQLLTDDLPIDAYLDRGFEAWLKKVSSGNQSDDN